MKLREIWNNNSQKASDKHTHSYKQASHSELVKEAILKSLKSFRAITKVAKRMGCLQAHYETIPVSLMENMGTIHSVRMHTT